MIAGFPTGAENIGGCAVHWGGGGGCGDGSGVGSVKIHGGA